jgi:hypothetical protein
MEDDEAKLDACSAQEQEHHAKQISVLNKLANSFKCMNNRLYAERAAGEDKSLSPVSTRKSWSAGRKPSDAASKNLGCKSVHVLVHLRNIVHALIVAIFLARSYFDIYPGCVIAPQIHCNIVNPFSVEVIV